MSETKEIDFKVAIAALRAALDRTNDVIRKCKFGVSAETCIDLESDTYLAFGYRPGRSGRDLHIRHRVTDPTEVEGWAVEHLGIHSGTISMRRAAAKAVPMLVDALQAMRLNVAEQVLKSSDQLSDYLDTLEKS